MINTIEEMLRGSAMNEVGEILKITRDTSATLQKMFDINPTRPVEACYDASKILDKRVKQIINEPMLPENATSVEHNTPNKPASAPSSR